MAVIANSVPFGGLTVDGVTFTVKEAHRHWQNGQDWLQYDVEVLMPDGVTKIQKVGWENLRVDNPDATLAAGTPPVQAEAAMLTRLTAMGATNIVAV